MVYIRTPGWSGALGQGPVRPPSRRCAAFNRASTPHDTASRLLIEQLRLPVTAEQTALQARRAETLRRLFRSLDAATAARLAARLNDMSDPLARFLDCELSMPLRAELRALLNRPPAPASSPPGPSPRAPWPFAPPWPPVQPPQPPPFQPSQPPAQPPMPCPPWARCGPGEEVIFDPPPPGISVTDLLRRARDLLDFALKIGLTGAAVAALAAALAEAGKLLAVFTGANIGGRLIFHSGVGRLQILTSPPGADAHYLVRRAVAAAMQRPEWAQLEARLRELPRFEGPVQEQLRDARGRFRPRQPGDQGPGSDWEEVACARVARNFPYSANKVYVRAYSAPPGTPNRRLGHLVIVDCIGSRSRTRGLKLFEAKQGGWFRRLQGLVYGMLEANGGQIITARGPYPAGLQLPVGTKVHVLTPTNIEMILRES